MYKFLRLNILDQYYKMVEKSMKMTCIGYKLDGYNGETHQGLFVIIKYLPSSKKSFITYSYMSSYAL